MATNQGFEGDLNHLEMTAIAGDVCQQIGDGTYREEPSDGSSGVGSTEVLPPPPPPSPPRSQHAAPQVVQQHGQMPFAQSTFEPVHHQAIQQQQLPPPLQYQLNSPQVMGNVSLGKSYTRSTGPGAPAMVGHVNPIVSQLPVRSMQCNSPAAQPARQYFQPQAQPEVGIKSGFDADGKPITFEVRWRNLTYTIPKPFWKMGYVEPKLALDNVCGSFHSGQLVALVGPSGSGKTVLLECLVGMRVTHLQGQVTVTKNRKRLKVAFVPQTDNLLTRFTVYETLVYASRLKNIDLRRRQHEEIAEQIVQDLNLEKCRDNLVRNCSGGQQKRITIAQELVSFPQILVLDEPTSGLDSTLCYQAMDLLRQLIVKSKARNDPMSIVTVIHQPPARVYNMFDKAFIFSDRGECVYEGIPKKMVPLLHEIGHPSPSRYNPADYIVEAAAYEYGDKIVEILTEIQSRPWRSEPGYTRYSTTTEGPYRNELVTAMKVPSKPFWLHFWIILCRSSMMIRRDPTLTLLRLVACICIPIYFSTLFGNDLGDFPGCPEYKKSILSMNHEELLKMPKDKMRYEWEETVYGYLYGFIAFLLMCISYSGVLVTILTFPLEFKVTMREHFNGWYKPISFYLGRLLAEVPYHVMFPIITSGVAYWCTNQPIEPVRFTMFTGTLVLVSLVSQTFGIFFGAIFVENLLAAVFMTPVAVMPMLLFSGFFTRVHNVHPYMKWMCDVSFLRHGFEAVLVSLFGFGRCVCDFDIPADDYVGDWVQCLALNTEQPIPEMCTQDGGLPDVLNRICGGGPRAVKTCAEFQPIPFTEFGISQEIIWRAWFGISVNIILLYVVSFMIMLHKLSAK